MAIGLLSLVLKISNSDEAKFLILCAKAYRGDPFAAAEVAQILAAKINGLIEKAR